MTTAYDLWDKQSIPAALQMLPPRTFARGLHDRISAGNVGKYELAKIEAALRKIIVTPTDTTPKEPDIIPVDEVPTTPYEHELTIIPRTHPLYASARAALKELGYHHALMVAEGLSDSPDATKLSTLAAEVLKSSDAADTIYKTYKRECQKQ